MLLKSFVALALIPEPDFEIGRVAFCSRNSDKNDESSLLDNVKNSNQLGLEPSSEDADGSVNFLFHPGINSKTPKIEDRKTAIGRGMTQSFPDGVELCSPYSS